MPSKCIVVTDVVTALHISEKELNDTWYYHIYNLTLSPLYDYLFYNDLSLKNSK